MRPTDLQAADVPSGWTLRVYAKDQQQYQPLHALCSKGPHGDVVSCWSLTFWERVRLLFGADVYLHVLTFGNRCRACRAYQGLQPVRLRVGPPVFEVADPADPTFPAEVRP